MSQNSEYKNIKELIASISKSTSDLESGKMGKEKLAELLEDCRNLHERIAVLQYLAFEREVKKENTPAKDIIEKEPVTKKTKSKEPAFKGNFQLNFGTPENETEKKPEDEDVHPNQINLIDAIEEQNEILTKEKDTVVEEKEVTNIPTDDSTPLSINDKFAEQTETSLAQKLSLKPIEKLKEAIALNEKFLYINDLFEGDNMPYNDAIEKYDNFNSIDEANTYTEELIATYNWDKSNKSVTNFLTLIERRYM